MRRPLPVFLSLVLCVALGRAAAQPPAAATDPDKDPQVKELLQDARRQINAKQPSAAIEQCDKVIAAFKAAYGGRKEKVLCGGTQAETLLYLVSAAAGKDSKAPVPPQLKEAANHAETIVLSSTWASACYLKGYALQELNRLDDARSALLQALDLSPLNAQFLSELGGVYELKKDWPAAAQQFELAEEHVALLPDVSQASELGRARRGLAYVDVELGKLDEAEKKYQQCLDTDPGDMRAQREMEYVRSLRAKKASH